MSVPDLSADCARCEALCCVALHFDASDSFAFDKPAGVACRHLADDNACRVHETLAARGMAGCARYDCLGAGQYVTQRLFDGGGWRRDPALLAPMMDALSRLRQVHELIQLLVTAAGLALPAAEEAQRHSLLARLAPPSGWTRATLAGLPLGAERAAVRAFLRSLRHAAPAPGAIPQTDGRPESPGR